ncbi:MAG: hypothetical protein KGH78_02390 [Candidatus Micrarchaeota archaeon]|nr:hypothetical protein [Candidatus Micrarchaeota archaeon]
MFEIRKKGKEGRQEVMVLIRGDNYGPSQIRSYEVFRNLERDIKKVKGVTSLHFVGEPDFPMLAWAKWKPEEVVERVAALKRISGVMDVHTSVLAPTAP